LTASATCTSNAFRRDLVLASSLDFARVRSQYKHGRGTDMSRYPATTDRPNPSMRTHGIRFSILCAPFSNLAPGPTSAQSRLSALHAQSTAPNRAVVFIHPLASAPNVVLKVSGCGGISRSWSAGELPVSALAIGCGAPCQHSHVFAECCRVRLSRASSRWPLRVRCPPFPLPPRLCRAAL
jgi:hypothetical protein